MDVLVVRNVTHDAEKAKDKKAALGTDIVIENFSKEEVNAYWMISMMLTRKPKELYLKLVLTLNQKKDQVLSCKWINLMYFPIQSQIPLNL